MPARSRQTRRALSPLTCQGFPPHLTQFCLSALFNCTRSSRSLDRRCFSPTGELEREPIGRRVDISGAEGVTAMANRGTRRRRWILRGFELSNRSVTPHDGEMTNPPSGARCRERERASATSWSSATSRRQMASGKLTIVRPRPRLWFLHRGICPAWRVLSRPERLSQGFKGVSNACVASRSLLVSAVDTSRERLQTLRWAAKRSGLGMAPETELPEPTAAESSIEEGNKGDDLRGRTMMPNC